MMLRHPRWIPPACRHSQTSPRSCPQSAGKSCHVVLAATTAVGRDPTSMMLTSWSTWPSSPSGRGLVMGSPAGVHVSHVLWRGHSDRHSFPGASEDAEDLSWFFAGATEPVRNGGVECRDFSGAEHQVLVCEDETDVAREDIDPFVTVVRPRLRGDLAGRDDDFPGLHAV